MGSKDQSNYHWNSNSIHHRNRKSYVKTDTISQKTLNSQVILIWESQAGDITLVSKHTSEPKYHNSHDTILKHWNRKDGRERSPHGYSHKMFDKGVENKHGEKENLFNNCADKNGFITTCRMKLDPFPSASTKIHSKWNKNLNVTHVCFCLVITFVFIRVLFLYWFLEFHTCIYVLTEFPLHPPHSSILLHHHFWPDASYLVLFFFILTEPTHCSQNVCVWVLGCYMGSLARVTYMWF